MNELQAAAVARAAGYPSQAARPAERRMSDDPGVRRSAVRIKVDSLVECREEERNGLTVVRVGGYASVTEHGYDMWDMFGPYTEIVSAGAFAKTLAASPTVEFALNHGRGGGASMARTSNDTLDLLEDETGLRYDAYVDPRRTDVKDMLLALERGDLVEASFKFRIDSGQWSPDYLEYRINAADIDRGDVSAVNFGANPAASSGLRFLQQDLAHARAREQRAAARVFIDDEMTTPIL